jgi:enoyl-CoA hydratase/carnithine racemase
MVELESSGGVARVFLSRPEKANALSTAFLEELFQAIAKLKGDPDLRVVVLAGRGKAFCGGADVNELKTLDESSAPAFVEKIHRVCRELRALPVPVVAQLHGAVIGAGLEIAAACDLRVAAEGTKLSMPEVKIGIPSVVEAALLPRLMGSGRAAWMVLTGEPIDARRAYEWGLIEKVSANLEGDVDALVKQIVSNDRKALRLQKELLQRWEEAPLSTSVAASLLAFREAHRK